MTYQACRGGSCTPRNLFHPLQLIVFACLLCSPLAWGQSPDKVGPANTFEDINARLSQRLKAMDWGEGRLSILVEDARLPMTAYAHAETTLMQPASLMKIITAATALERLGEDFQFSTRLLTGGAIEGRTLKGPLVIQGTGDPSFPVYDPALPDSGWAVFDRWAQMLRDKGIRKIEGDIVGDDRAFDDRSAAAGWPSGLLGNPEIPIISALNFNTNCVSIYWKTGRKTRHIAPYKMFPALPDYVYFSNNLRVMKPVRRPRKFSRVENGNLITAGGEIEPQTQALDRVSIDDPTTFFAQALKQRLMDKKIKIDGEALAIGDHDGEINDSDLQLVAEQTSPPLKTLLAEMMRHDRTLYAECILKALARQASDGQQGSFEGGTQVINDYFSKLRLPGANRIFIDGSGLSSNNRLSAAHVVNLLRRIESRPRTRDIAACFPQAWEEGVLKDRFRPAAKPSPDGETKAEDAQSAPDAELKAPPVRAIAGSGDGVEVMAGWVTNRTGRRMLFAIMVDASKAPAFQLQKQIDLLVLEIANSGLGR